MEGHDAANARARLVDDITARVSDRNVFALGVLLIFRFTGWANTKADYRWADTDILLPDFGLDTETAQGILDGLCERGRVVAQNLQLDFFGVVEHGRVR